MPCLKFAPPLNIPDLLQYLYILLLNISTLVALAHSLFHSVFFAEKIHTFLHLFRTVRQRPATFRCLSYINFKKGDGSEPVSNSFTMHVVRTPNGHASYITTRTTARVHRS